ncbi:MAG: GNAT family N-acetyltransferase [Bacillota bacterium]
MTLAQVRAVESILPGGAKLVVRAARPEDTAGLLAATVAVFEERGHTVTEPDEFQVTEEQERAWVQRHLDDPGSLVLVAEVDGVVIGSLSLERPNRRRLAHTAILGIVVTKEWRGRGVGTALIRSALAWAAESGAIEKVCLSVFSSNAGAIELYERLGFAEEGRRPRGIKVGPGSYVDEVLMYRFVTR